MSFISRRFFSNQILPEETIPANTNTGLEESAVLKQPIAIVPPTPSKLKGPSSPLISPKLSAYNKYTIPNNDESSVSEPSDSEEEKESESSFSSFETFPERASSDDFKGSIEKEESRSSTSGSFSEEEALSQKSSISSYDKNRKYTGRQVSFEQRYTDLTPPNSTNKKNENPINLTKEDSITLENVNLEFDETDEARLSQSKRASSKRGHIFTNSDLKAIGFEINSNQKKVGSRQLSAKDARTILKRCTTIIPGCNFENEVPGPKRAAALQAAFNAYKEEKKKKIEGQK